MNFQEAAEGFEAIKGKVYLDTATTGPLHKKVYEAAKGYLDQRYNHGADLQDYKDWLDKADAVRARVADFLNCEAEEVAYTKNASEGMNHAAHTIPFKPGDNVIVPDLSFPSNALVFRNLEKQGVEVKTAKSHHGQIPFEELISHVDERTRAISVCHVEFSSGYKHDIQRIGAFTRERDIIFHLDATQAAGAMVLDVEAHNVDFLSFSPYKWLCCPLGVGVFYCNKRILKHAQPRHVGWLGVRDRFSLSLNLDLADTAEMFESGGLNYSGVFALDEAIKLYQELGPQKVENRILQLNNYVIDQLTRIGIDIVGPFDEKHRSGITYAMFPSQENREKICKALKDHNIQVNVGKDQTRISPHFFNTEGDIDTLITALMQS